MPRLNLSPQLLAYVDAQVRAHGLSGHNEYVRALLRREPDRSPRLQLPGDRTAAAPDCLASTRRGH